MYVSSSSLLPFSISPSSFSNQLIDWIVSSCLLWFLFISFSWLNLPFSLFHYFKLFVPPSLCVSLDGSANEHAVIHIVCPSLSLSLICIFFCLSVFLSKHSSYNTHWDRQYVLDTKAVIMRPSHCKLEVSFPKCETFCNINIICLFLSVLFSLSVISEEKKLWQPLDHSVDVGPSGKGTSLSKNGSVLITGESSTQLRNKKKKNILHISKLQSWHLKLHMKQSRSIVLLLQMTDSISDDTIVVFLLLIIFFSISPSCSLVSLSTTVTSFTPPQSIIYISPDEPQTVKRSFRRPWRSRAGL